jgi:hypothetical protein
MTAKALDILAKERSASALPRVVISRADNCDPNRAMPKIARELDKHEMDRTASELPR